MSAESIQITEFGGFDPRKILIKHISKMFKRVFRLTIIVLSSVKRQFVKDSIKRSLTLAVSQNKNTCI